MKRKKRVREVFRHVIDRCACPRKMKEIRMDAKRKAILAAIGGFSFFSIGDAAFKHLGATLSSPAICFYTAAFSLMFLLLFAWRQGGLAAHLRTNHLRVHLARGAIVFSHASLGIVAFSALPMATVYSMFFLAPFLIALLAIRFLGEKATRAHWAAILVGFSGILIVLRPGLVPLSPPVLAGLAAAILFSISCVIVRRIRAGNDSPICFAFYVQIMILAGAFVLMTIQGIEIPNGSEILFLMLAGAMTMLGNMFLARAYLLAPSAGVAPFHYVQILWAVALGALFFGDFPDLWTGVGAALIIGAGLFLIRVESGKPIP